MASTGAAKTLARHASSVDTARALAKPILLRGPVVTGFQRGSKELGFPTANLDAASARAIAMRREPQSTSCLAAENHARPCILQDLLERSGALSASEVGVYFGWAGLRGQTFKMVMSIGWNPVYKNEKKTVEPYLMHTFETDFYGEDLQLVVCGFLRPEQNYDGLEPLIAAINEDIDVARELLDTPKYAASAASIEGCKL